MFSAGEADHRPSPSIAVVAASTLHVHPVPCSGYPRDASITSLLRLASGLSARSASMQRTTRTLAAAAVRGGECQPFAWFNNAEAGPSRSGGSLTGKTIAVKENISFAQATTSASSSVLHGEIKLHYMFLTGRVSAAIFRHVRGIVDLGWCSYRWHDQDG